MCILLGSLSAAAWIVAIIGTDRYLFLQYLYWFNGALVLAAGTLLAIGLALKGLTGTIKRRAALRFAAAFAVLLTLFVGRAWGVFRWAAHLTDPSPPRGGSIRVLHWNLSLPDVPPRVDVGERITSEGTPDIVFLSMPYNPRIWEKMAEAMKRSPEDKIHLIVPGSHKVISRYPVQPGAIVYIPFDGKDTAKVGTAPPWLRTALSRVYGLLNVSNRSVDRLEPATVAAFTFDTRAQLGRTTVAWFIDMPSNVLVSRRDMAAHVAERAAVLQKAGKLPAPDFIIGDFNIPAGSASLKTYAPGFTDAVYSAGLGRLATWPRPSPLLHIDHILISPQWRATEYRIIDPGASEHMAQTAILWPVDARPSTTPPAPPAPTKP